MIRGPLDVFFAGVWDGISSPHQWLGIPWFLGRVVFKDDSVKLRRKLLGWLPQIVAWNLCWNSRILLWRWKDDFCGWIYAVDIICCWKLAKVWNELQWIGPGLKDGSFNGEKSWAKMYSRKFLEIAGFSWVATFFRTFAFVEALPIGILFFNRKSKTKVGYESAFYVKDMGHSAIYIYIMSNISYRIILWNSTLSTILKHSKSRNNQRSPPNFPPNLGFSTKLGIFHLCCRVSTSMGSSWKVLVGKMEKAKMRRGQKPREGEPGTELENLGPQPRARMRVVGWDVRIPSLKLT